MSGVAGRLTQGGRSVRIEGRRAEISRRSGRGPARRAVLVAVCGLAPMAAGPRRAAAQQSGFVVQGVLAEASAENATAARERAFASGLRAAWATLVSREAPADQARLSAISPEDLDRLVESFEVENERVGATRYAALLTVFFRPDAVRALLASRPSAGPIARIEVVAPLSGVADWAEIRRRLAGAPAVRSVEVLALSRREARLALTLPDGLSGAAAALEPAGLRLRDGMGPTTLILSPGT